MTKEHPQTIVGVIGAMKEEVDILKSWMDILKTESIAHTDVYIGTLDSNQIVLVESGIGKVNATLITSSLIDRYNVEVIVNTGVAGALSNSLNVTDMAVSTAVVHHDVDAIEFGYDFGQVPGMPKYYHAGGQLVEAAEKVLDKNENIKAFSGLIASGDSFIADSEQKASIISNFPEALAVDMESASIAQTCHQFNVPFVIIRSISDRADGAADMTYGEFLEKACINSSEAVKLLLNEL